MNIFKNIKKSHLKSVVLLSLIIKVTVFFVFFYGCKKDDKTTDEPKPNIVPKTFAVIIPSSVNAAVSSKDFKSSTQDTLEGNDAYQMLRGFVAVASGAAQITNDIMTAIYAHNLSQPTSFNFTGDDDHRLKHCDVIAGAIYNNVNYQYRLTITDSLNVNAVGIQVFWNTSPIKGIAILNPYNIDRIHHDISYANTRYMIEYSEAETTYQKQMTVSIAGIPLSGNWSINNMKMFVGKNNDLLTMYGNTNHPMVTIVDVNNPMDRSYSFVAHVNDLLNIAVAKVGLPPSLLAQNDSVLTEYSLYNVLHADIVAAFPTLPQTYIDTYLLTAKSPAYFMGNTGFIGCGTTVPSFAGFNDATFLDIANLKPYIPNDVRTLTISFQ